MYDFCDVYIEGSKFILAGNDKEQAKLTLQVLFCVLETGLRLLHPMMPFLSEDLYQKLPQFSTKSESLCVSKYPEFQQQWESQGIEHNFESIFNIVKQVRSMCVQVNLGPSVKPDMYFSLTQQDDDLKNLVLNETVLLQGLAKISNIRFAETENDIPEGCISAITNKYMKLNLVIKGHIKIEDEIARLNKKKEANEKLLEAQHKKMNIKDYETNVPEKIKIANKEKLDAYLLEKQQIEESLETMSKLI